MAFLERFAALLYTECTCREHFGEGRTSVVLSVTDFTLCRVFLCDILMSFDPALTDRVHTVWTTADSVGDRAVTAATFADRPGMSLDTLCKQIVCLMCRIDRMGGTVARLTLQFAVTCTESVETDTCHRRVGIGRKPCIDHMSECIGRRINR